MGIRPTTERKVRRSGKEAWAGRFWRWSGQVWLWKGAKIDVGDILPKFHTLSTWGKEVITLLF